MKTHTKVGIGVTLINLLIIGALALTGSFNVTENLVYFVSLLTFWLGIKWEGIINKIFRPRVKKEVKPVIQPPRPVQQPLPSPTPPQPQPPEVQLPQSKTTSEQPRPLTKTEIQPITHQQEQKSKEVKNLEKEFDYID